jgi:hypothetical protein
MIQIIPMGHKTNFVIQITDDCVSNVLDKKKKVGYSQIWRNLKKGEYPTYEQKYTEF